MFPEDFHFLFVVNQLVCSGTWIRRDHLCCTENVCKGTLSSTQLVRGSETWAHLPLWIFILVLTVGSTWHQLYVEIHKFTTSPAATWALSWRPPVRAPSGFLLALLQWTELTCLNSASPVFTAVDILKLYHRMDKPFDLSVSAHTNQQIFQDSFLLLI